MIERVALRLRNKTATAFAIGNASSREHLPLLPTDPSPRGQCSVPPIPDSHRLLRRRHRPPMTASLTVPTESSLLLIPPPMLSPCISSFALHPHPHPCPLSNNVPPCHATSSASSSPFFSSDNSFPNIGRWPSISLS